MAARSTGRGRCFLPRSDFLLETRLCPVASCVCVVLIPGRILLHMGAVYQFRADDRGL